MKRKRKGHRKKELDMNTANVVSWLLYFSLFFLNCAAFSFLHVNGLAMFFAKLCIIFVVLSAAITVIDEIMHDLRRKTHKFDSFRWILYVILTNAATFAIVTGAPLLLYGVLVHDFVLVAVGWFGTLFATVALIVHIMENVNE